MDRGHDDQRSKWSEVEVARGQSVQNLKGPAMGCIVIGEGKEMMYVQGN